MPTIDLGNNTLPPVAIGGIGGSGTRLIAQLLIDLGFNLGDDLNYALDNLSFSMLFRRKSILELPEPQFHELAVIFINTLLRQRSLSIREKKIVHDIANSPHSIDIPNWLKGRCDRICSDEGNKRIMSLWGWKEPNTHIVLDYLVESIPTLKYIHVVRNGLDMAYSKNKHQVKLWGDHILKGKSIDNAYSRSLSYWRAVHERVLSIGDRMGINFYFLNYDDLCLNPRVGLKGLLDFLKLDLTADKIAELMRQISPPDTIGRFKSYDINVFDSTDIKYVQKLGFDTSVQ